MMRQIRANQSMLANAGSLVGTTAVTSGLGFIYWWLAARFYTPDAVGMASAAISAMTLLGNIGMSGLGTLLMGELPRRRGHVRPVIITSLAAAGALAAGAGTLFAVATPVLGHEFAVLAQSPATVTLFALGVALTGMTLVIDQAMIGLARGEIQLGRNALFAVAKLVALLAAGLWVAPRNALVIYITWVLGLVVSLAALATFAQRRGSVFRTCRPQWGLLRQLGRPALQHYGLNLALLAPSLALPVIVTALLSASLNASFYAAWMVASFAYVGPTALSTVLYATASSNPSMLAEKMRVTLGLSAIIGILACSVLLVAAGIILGFFGPSYARQATGSLRILGLAVFPWIVKVHYVAIRRVQERIATATGLMVAGMVLELALATAGALWNGVPGLSLGWLVALSGEALLIAPTVYRATKRSPTPQQQEPMP